MVSLHSTIDICSYDSMSHKNDMTVPAIDYNDSNFYTSLFESSSNKKYIAFVSTSRVDQETLHQKSKRTITVINNTSGPRDTDQFYLTFCSQPEFGFDTESVHITRRITHIFPDNASESFIYFLSVSNDGKLICLSSFDRCVDDSYCVIYRVENERIVKTDQMKEINKIGGYGVFMDNGQFAIINNQSLYIYNRHFSLTAYFSISELVQHTWKNGLETDMIKSWATFLGLYNGKKPYMHPDQDSLQALVFISQHLRQGVLYTIDKIGLFQAYVIEEDLRRITDGKGRVISVSGSKSFYAIFDGRNGWSIVNSNNNVVAYRLQLYYCMYPLIFSSLHATFSHCERYFVVSAIVLDKKSQFVHSLYLEIWDLLYERSIFHVKPKLSTVIPLEICTVGFWPPIVAFEEQAQESYRLSRTAMKVTYTTFEKNKFCIKSGMIKFDHPVPRQRIHYSIEHKVQSHLLEPIGGIYSFDESASKKLHTICVRKDKAKLHFTVHISNKGEINYSFKAEGELYCIVIRAHMLEVWHRKSIQNTTYSDLSKRKKNKMDQSMGGIFYDSEMVFARAFKYMILSFDSPSQVPCAIKNFDRLVNVGVMPSIETIEESIQVLEAGPNEGTVIRLTLESSSIERTEDIYIPMIKSTGRKNDLYNRRWYNDYVFENACSALFYFSDQIDPKDYTLERYSKKKARKQQIQRMISKCLTNMKELKSNYFESVRGSDTLTLLARFEDGRKILFRIIQMQEINICLFNRHYKHTPYKHNMKIGKSALTVLIAQKDFGLYKLLLNRIIRDSSKINGFPLSFCIIDALFILQHEENRDLLSKTIRSLDYIPLEKSLIDGNFSTDTLDHFDISTEQGLIRNRNLFRHTFAQLEHVEASTIYKTSYKRLISSIYHKLCRFRKDTTISKPLILGNTSLTGNYTKPCIVPLSHFNTYLNINSDLPLPYGPNLSIKNYKKSSVFVAMATNHFNCNMFDEGDLITALILQHKWNHFVKGRFFLVSHVYLLFYCTYFLAVPFSYEQFEFIPGESFVGDNKGHLACVVLFFASGAFLIFQEIRQYQSSPRKYLSSFYNYIDILVMFLTVFTFIQMVCGLNYLDEVESVCALIVWFHGLLKLRAFHYFGTTLEVVIQLFRKVSEIILFMVLVVFAFTNAFIILLRKKDDSYFQEQYTGTMTPSDGIQNASTVSFVDDTSNDFTDVFKAFKDVWFFIFGVWDSISSGDSDDNVMAMILAIFFSFIVLILFFNIVIGFMSASIEEVILQGRKAWLNHFRDVIVEIEQFWCTEHEKRRRKNNPAFMFYAANDEEIKRQQEILRVETEKLIKEYKAMGQLT